MTLDEDPRWIKFQHVGFTCACCGEHIQGVHDLALAKPDCWPHEEVYAENKDLCFDGDFLSEDFCVVSGEHFIVRSVLELPIIGSDLHFGFGVWSTLSRENFERYVETFNSGEQASLGPMFSWLMNRLDNIYPDAFAQKSRLFPQDGRQRPKVVLEQTDHPLSAEQRGGISFDRLLEIYALGGHDIRPSLTSH